MQRQSLRVWSDYCDANALVFKGGGYADELPFVTVGEKIAEFINSWAFESVWNPLFWDVYIHTRAPHAHVCIFPPLVLQTLGAASGFVLKWHVSSCTTLAGDRRTKLGSLRKVASLVYLRGTLSILTCRQKKHAIEVLGRVLTAVAVLRCICVNVMTFSRVHKCNPNACHTLKMHQVHFLTKDLFFARSPNQRIPRVPRAPKARATKNWRYCG